MKLKITRRLFCAVALLTAFNLLFAPLSKTAAAAAGARENTVLATLNFDPKVSGFGFENGFSLDDMKGSLGTEDLIRMFGAKAVCKTGSTAEDCVLKAAAGEWMEKQLKGLGEGVCDGMAVAALRFHTKLPFKGRTAPADFQSAAKQVFDLKADPAIKNYIAYYFVTQTFNEVTVPTNKTADLGPVGVVKELIEGTKKGEGYAVGIYKTVNGEKKDGHSISAMGVDEDENQYRIIVYDNNYPGETRYITVQKEGNQQWKYVTATNAAAQADNYIGDINTKTLEITANSYRDLGCFDAPFADAGDEKQCTPVVETAAGGNKNSAAPKPTRVNDGETAEFYLDGEAQMLITTADGKRTGFDAKAGRYYTEIPGSVYKTVKGGRGYDLPHVTVPAQESGKAYTVTFSGKGLKEETVANFIYSAPGFAVGLDNIRIDPNETLTASFDPDGEMISFTASADGETPEIYFAFDPEGAGEDSESSYMVELDPQELEAGKTLTAEFDYETGTLNFKDNDGKDGDYDVEVERIGANGKTNKFNSEDIGKGDKGQDSYEVNLPAPGKKDAELKATIQHDEEGDGFNDDEPEDLPDEEDEGDDEDEPLARSAAPLTQNVSLARLLGLF